MVTDAFDDALNRLSQHAQTAREGADYEAATPTPEDAERYVADAADFVTAAEEMLEAG